MGNEMGNSNVSGMQEQENNEVEALNKCLEASIVSVNADGNQPVSSAKEEYLHKKHAGLASEDPLGVADPSIEKQTSDEKDQDTTEVQALDGFSKDSMDSNDDYGIRSGIQLVSSLEDGNFHEKSTGLASEQYISNDHQFKRLTSSRREGEETGNSSLDTKFKPNNPESVVVEDLKSDQQEITEIHTQPSMEDKSEWPESVKEEILGSDGPHGSNGKGKKLEDGIVESPDGSLVPKIDSETEKNGDGLLMELMESQEGNVVEMSDSYEKKIEITKDGAEAGNKTTLLSDVGNEGDEEQRPTRSNLVRNDSVKLQLEAVPLTESLDSFQLEASESKDKCVLLADDTKLIENGPEVEQNKHDAYPTPPSDEAREKLKEDEVNNSQTEFFMKSTDHEEKRRSDFDKIEVPDNGLQVDMDHNNPSLISEKQHKDGEEDTEMVAEIDTHPTKFTVTDSYHEKEELPMCSLSLSDRIEEKVIQEMAEKAEDSDPMGKDTEESEPRETMKLGLSLLPLIEPAETLLQPSPVSPVQSQESRQENFLVGNETMENGGELTVESDQESCGKEVAVSTEASNFDSADTTIETIVSAVELESENSEQDPLQYPEITTVSSEPSDISMGCSWAQEQTCNLTKHTCGHDSNSGNEKPEFSESFNSESNQTKLTAKIHIRTLSSFEFVTNFTETEVPAIQSQSSDQIPLFHRSISAQVAERLATESNPEDINIHVEGSNSTIFGFELPVEARTGESDQTPLLHQEKPSFRTLDKRIDVSVENPVAETAFYALKTSKEGYSQDPLQDDEMAVEKKEAALERSDSEKLRTPLLSFLKEEKSYVAVSQGKQKRLDTKKEVEDVWNSRTDKTKRKPKSSLFSNCLCCTAVIN